MDSKVEESEIGKHRNMQVELQLKNLVVVALFKLKLRSGILKLVLAGLNFCPSGLLWLFSLSNVMLFQR